MGGRVVFSKVYAPKLLMVPDTHVAIQAWGAPVSADVEVRSPKLTVGFSQSSYILMAYRVVGAGALYGVWLDGGAVPNEPNDRVDLRLVDLSKSRAPEPSGQGSVPLPVDAQRLS